MAKYPTLPKLFKSEIEEHFAPKLGGSTINPPLLSEDGTITHYWCKHHERYELVEYMVISNGKSKGHCKASNATWNKRNAHITKLSNSIFELILQDKFDESKEVSEEVKLYKEELNSNFDYIKDWKSYVANNPKFIVNDEMIDELNYMTTVEKW